MNWERRSEHNHDAWIEVVDVETAPEYVAQNDDAFSATFPSTSSTLYLLPARCLHPEIVPAQAQNPPARRDTEGVKVPLPFSHL